MSKREKPVNPKRRKLTSAERKFIAICFKHSYSHVLRLWTRFDDGFETRPQYVLLPCTLWGGLMSNYLEVPQPGFCWYFWEGRSMPSSPELATVTEAIE